MVEIGEIEMDLTEPEALNGHEAQTTEERESADVQLDQPSEADAVAEVEVAEEPVEEDRGEWYVIHSYSGYENKVEKNLGQRIETMGMQEKIFRVVVPTEEEVEIRGGQRRTSRRRIFPGYVLVKMILDEESWYAVRNTPGVTGFVGLGATPTPLTKEEVDKILQRMDEDQPTIKVSFRVGETIRIVGGPFADFMGVVDEIYPERGKVRLLVSFFGRETPVEMDFLQIERI